MTVRTANSEARQRMRALRDRRGAEDTTGHGIEPEVARKPMRFSIYFFSADEHVMDADKYRLVMEAARYADANGYTAIWTPERHFHSFGGLYPSPAVLSSALAASTTRIGIRAGSVVLPLHHPVRVAEDWSVIDNISGGRVGVSFASGWSPRDFVFAPDRWQQRNDVMFRDIELVRRLWRGESVRMPSGAEDIGVTVHPRPVQPTLPVWVSSGGGRDTCVRAGTIGANLLTGLIRQSPQQMAANIAAYRAARGEAGHDPHTGQVTVMLHTFLADSPEAVRDTVREPLSEYLGTFLQLLRETATDHELDPDRLTTAERAAVVEHAMDRYMTTNGLFGTPATVRTQIERLRAMGVDEVACLLDFGLRPDVVLDGLRCLTELRNQVTAP